MSIIIIEISGAENLEKYDGSQKDQIDLFIQLSEENIGATKNVLINAKFMKEIMKEIMKEKGFTDEIYYVKMIYFIK